MTREEAIESIEGIKSYYTDDRDFSYYGDEYEGLTDDDNEALDMAIKALEQQPILDKIRAEIIDTLYVDSLIFGELIDFRNGKISADDVIEEFNRVTRIEILQIIDKYKAESEGE